MMMGNIGRGMMGQMPFPQQQVMMGSDVGMGMGMGIGGMGGMMGGGYNMMMGGGHMSMHGLGPHDHAGHEEKPRFEPEPEPEPEKPDLFAGFVEVSSFMRKPSKG